MACAFPKCRADDVMTWLSNPLCQRHWEYVCVHPDRARERLGVEPRLPMRVPYEEEPGVVREPIEEDRMEELGGDPSLPSL